MKLVGPVYDRASLLDSTAALLQDLLTRKIVMRSRFVMRRRCRITPMMSMIRTLADRGDKRPVILLYGSKGWDSVTFREELDALEHRLNLTVVHVLVKPPASWT